MYTTIADRIVVCVAASDGDVSIVVRPCRRENRGYKSLMITMLAPQSAW